MNGWKEGYRRRLVIYCEMREQSTLHCDPCAEEDPARDGSNGCNKGDSDVLRRDRMSCVSRARAVKTDCHQIERNRESSETTHAEENAEEDAEEDAEEAAAAALDAADAADTLDAMDTARAVATLYTDPPNEVATPAPLSARVMPTPPAEVISVNALPPAAANTQKMSKNAIERIE